MFRCLIAATLVTLLCATLVAQHSITISQPTNFFEQVTVPAYDSANGPLRSVTLCLRYRHGRTIRCESLDAQPALVDVGFSLAKIDFLQGANLLTSLCFAAESQSNSLSAFDSTLDYMGTSACATSSMNKGDALIHIDDPAILAAFIDTGTVTLTADGLDFFNTSGPGNLCTESTTQFELAAEVIYNN